MEIHGPAWHSSEQRDEHGHNLTRFLAPVITVELHCARVISQLFGYGEITDDRVNSFSTMYHDGVPEITVDSEVPVKKLQTLEKPDMPLLQGKESEKSLHPLLRYQRDTAMDEAPQLTQLTWDLEQPGDLSLVGIRPQQVSELQLMANILNRAGKRDLFARYNEQYNNLQKGYASPESLIGFSYQHGTLEYCLARCTAVNEYWQHGSRALDKNIINTYMQVGVAIRANYDMTNKSAVRDRTINV